MTLVTDTPPLALFQSTTDRGPFTIKSDLMMEKFGIPIGVVSLPATYRDHPVLWAGLSHEVGGHDVVHADHGLVAEMVSKTRALLAPHFDPRHNHDTATLNALIWSFWMDEAAADVYGVLNMGPIFAVNLAGFLTAFAGRRRPTDAGAPSVLTDTELRPNGQMDDHPIDLLRFYIAAGAVDGLKGLSVVRRDDRREHRGCCRARRGWCDRGRPAGAGRDWPRQFGRRPCEYEIVGCCRCGAEGRQDARDRQF